MYVLIGFFIVILLHFIGSNIKTRFSSLVNGFLIIYSLFIIPVISYYLKTINFIIFSYLILFIILSIIIVTIVRYKKLIYVFNSWHVLIVSIVWIIIYLLNNNFSILTANGFDDYHYLGLQKILINNIKISPNYKEHAANIVEGWLYINAAISKIFCMDSNIFNKVSMSIVNIFITSAVVENTAKVFKTRLTNYSVYGLLLLLLFPIFSFEFWFGSISRLIYRPFYGSSLSVICTNFLILYLTSVFDATSKKNKIFILCIFLSIIINIHINNILLILFYYLYYKVDSIHKLLPYIGVFIVWIGINIFGTYLLNHNISKSTHEYYNVMYDVTRYPFVLSYLFGIVIFLIKKKRNSIDRLTILFIPFLILFIFFSESIKLAAFNTIYGFGLQRFISQTLVILFIYIITNIFSSEDRNIKKILGIFIIITSISYITHSTLYSGLIQNRKHILTRIDDDSVAIDKIVGDNKNILTQNWINIKPQVKVDLNTYYSYISTNSCSYNLFSNLKSSTNSNAYYYINDFSKFDDVIRSIKKYNVDTVISTEKYRHQNNLLCEENLDVLWNKFAKDIIIKNAKLSIEQIKQNKINDWLKKNSKSYKTYNLKTEKSLFGKIYIYNLKED